jgi:hypothetical protein
VKRLPGGGARLELSASLSDHRHGVTISLALSPQDRLTLIAMLGGTAKAT